MYELNLLQKKNDLNTENSKETVYAYRHNIDYRLIQFTIEILEYLINELFFKTANMNHIQSHQTEFFEKLDINYMLSYSKKHLPEFYPLVSFYFYIYKSCLNSDDTYYYYIARKILTKDLNNISKELRTVLNYYMIDYNIMKINSSE